MGSMPDVSPAQPRTASVQQRPRRSRRRVWLFRCVALALPFLGLAALELICRLTGAGLDLSLAIPLHGQPGRFRINPAVDQIMYGPRDVAGPEPRVFQLPKPAGTYRILMLGGSTTFGFPYASEVAFPRQMEALLNQQEPETPVEVLNAGVTSMNSFFVAEMARDSAACAPDLIVVHSGNNEFYGPGGPASNAFDVSPRWMRTVLTLRRTRLAQLVSRLLPGSGPIQQHLLDSLPTTMEIPWEGPVFQRAENNYRENMRQCIEAARAAGIPILLTAEACNLRDQGPMRSLPPAGLDSTHTVQWDELVSAAEAKLLTGEQSAAEEAVTLLEQAGELWAGSARVEYRRGQALQVLGRSAEARAAYSLARDLDACRFRAPSTFNTICREVAESSPDGSGVFYLDFPAEIDRVSDPTGPGSDLFLEHVHYDLRGQRVAGTVLAKFIQQNIRGRAWDESRVPDDVRLDEILGIIPEDNVAGCSFALMTLESAALRGALDARYQEQRLTQRIAAAFEQLSPERQEAFADVAMDVMANDLIGGLSAAHDKRGNESAVRLMLEAATKRRSWQSGAKN